MQKEIDVFISYSRKDYVDDNHNPIKGNVISELKNRFQENGISFWIDDEGIYSGNAFAQIIARNIKRCKIFVFVSSQNSNDSSWTCNEIATAAEYKKVIIPLRIDHSSYHEDIVLYLAKLDYISYHINKDTGLKRLIDSILGYKQEWENERIAAARIQEEKERKEQEEEEKRRRAILEEQDKKEQERLATIALEKKRQEEELTMILNQVSELEKTESELESQKDEYDKEKKKIEREILLIRKQLEHLDTRRIIIESQLIEKSSDVIKEDTQSNKDDINRNTNEFSANIIKTLFCKTHKSLIKLKARFWRESSRKTSIIIQSFAGISVLVAIVLLCSRYYPYNPDNPHVDPDTLINHIPDSIQADSVLISNIIPVEDDSVYGIETLDKINWENMNFRTLDNVKHLHKVTFALMLCTSGKNDYSGETYEYNRTEANKHGIYFASYHLLNTNSKWRYATGERQANNYISHVRELHSKELPPVLSIIDDIKKGDEMIAKKRCLDWLRIVSEHYKMKPIVFVKKSIYEDHVKHWKLDNVIWMPTANTNIDCIKFQKLHYKKIQLYNDTIAQDSIPRSGCLSVYKGTYKDFIDTYGQQK